MGRRIAPRPLVEKIAEICRKLDPVPKRGNNGKYAYQRAPDIAAVFREELFRRHILILEKELECDLKIFKDNLGAKFFLAKVKIEFCITDGRRDQDLIGSGSGVGLDQSDKAIFKAKTGALKYWLRDLGLLLSDEEDPDATAELSQRGAIADHDAQATPHQKSREQAYQQRAWTAAVPTSGRTEKQIQTYLLGKFNVTDVTLITSKEFDEAMKWLLGHEPLAKTLQMSVEVAQKSNGGAA